MIESGPKYRGTSESKIFELIDIFNEENLPISYAGKKIYKYLSKKAQPSFSSKLKYYRKP
jgi:hypothetical protein